MQGYWKIPSWDVSNLFASWYRCHQTRGEPQLLRLIHREKHGKERLQRLEDLLKDLQEKADLMTPELQEVDDMVTVKIVFIIFGVFLFIFVIIVARCRKQHRKQFFVTTYVMPSCQAHFPILHDNSQAKRKTLTEMDQKKSEVVLALWKKISEDTTTVPQLFETMNGRRLRDSCGRLVQFHPQSGQSFPRNMEWCICVCRFFPCMFHNH